MILKLKKLTDLNTTIPAYHSAGASGLDLHAAIEQDLFIPAGERRLISCGYAFEIPAGYEGQVRPRSGISKEKGLMAVFGTIDADYRGEVKVNLMNLSFSGWWIKPNDRIAQLVIVPVVQCATQLTDVLSDTIRGDSGFGHTGAN